MKSVIDHRYAGAKKTAVHNAVSGAVIGFLTPGAWIGVQQIVDEWIRIISVEFDGWVKQADTIDGEDLKLSIIPPKPIAPSVIHYALSA